VDGAIHRVGGKEILEECRKIRQTEFPKGLPTGQSVITTGGNLKARFVIHTVGPVHGQNNGQDAQLLADCYKNSLALAVENKLTTIAFPSISTGAFQYPRHQAAAVASGAIKDFLQSNDSLKEVRLIFFSASDTLMFLRHQNFV
jgi:O-acetyl-ADP-ribose deacetylase